MIHLILCLIFLSTLLPLNANAESWECKVAWNFGNSDKEYSGKGTTRDAAINSAQANCKISQVFDEWRNYCDGPKTKTACNNDAPIKPPEQPKFSLQWCAVPSSPQDATRILQNLRHSDEAYTSSSSGSFAYLKYPKNLPPPTKVYCYMHDAYLQEWCKLDFNSPSACSWAWPIKYDDNKYNDWIRDGGDSWILKMNFYNQSDNRWRNFQIYVE
ncbi:hypothetical protein ACQZ4Q_10915 [Agrobacterium vitis]